MSFNPIKVGGWAFGEILTSSQMNQLNTDFPFAIDGRSGGNYGLTGDLSIATSTTKAIAVNALTMPASADGGGAAIYGANGLTVVGGASVGGGLTVAGESVLSQKATVSGYVRTGGRFAAGSPAAGVHLYGPDVYQHVFNDGFNPSSGCIWKIDPGVTTIGDEWMRFVNYSATGGVEIQGPTGATLWSNIIYIDGFTFAVTVAKVAGTWTVVDRTFK